jgi:2'-hydroxyisoflavone reductase
MRLLVLGGTLFLGRAVVEAALARGHSIAVFNRGRTNPGLFPQVEQLRGDRDGDLSELEGRSWDAVVDTSGYLPRVVRASAELLRRQLEHYVFVSTVSVYAFPLPAWFDESAPRAVLARPTEEVSGETYGALKAACEDVVREVFAGAFANVRAGLIVGPHDPTGRFTYWPVRLARGGDVLAPGDPERPVQLVDVRDLGAWLVEAAERRVVGDFNATGPQQPLPMRTLLETCRSAAASDAELVWIPDDFLLARGAGPWLELPLWVPAEDASVLQVGVERAVNEGLRFRPLVETAADTLAWAEAAGGTGTGPGTLASGIALEEAGMRPEKESALLAAWRAHSGSAG